jgi:hypothetical protein
LATGPARGCAASSLARGAPLPSAGAASSSASPAATSPAAGLTSNACQRNRERARTAGSLPISGHLQRKILDAGLIADRHLLLRRRQTQDLYLDVPHARPKIKNVVSVLVGIADHFQVTLMRRHSGSGDWLVCGEYISALFRRA